uniref:WH1 domain-containing protein n=1 Tax=Anopheles culicifacies TaxID=139723 RepID=A0A182MUB4_9DIPT
MFGDGGRTGDHDSDDDETAPTATGQYLAKIFGIAPKAAVGNGKRANAPVAPKPVKISERYGPSSFRYIPAEPDDEEATEDANKPPEWSIVRASVVTAYKLVNGDNMFLGKLGLALLNSTIGHRLLLYRTKTDVLGTVTLERSTKILLKQDYLQFTADDSNEFWSVLFESETDRQALLNVIESCCQVDREPVIEEPLSEVEKDVEPPKNKRSELAARMARMGGQAMPSMLEKSKAPPIPTTAPGSDSSDTSDSKIETISTRPIRRPNVMSAVNMQMVPMAGMIPTNASGMPVSGQPTGATMADMNFNLVMSESRMQNTEMRMNLTKLESKLDRVLDKIDLLNLHGSGDRTTGTVDKDAEVLELEEKLLELKRANHALKSKVRTLETAERDGKREADAMLEEKLQTLEESERRLKESALSLERRLEASRLEVAQQKQMLGELEKKLTEEKHSTESKTKEMRTMQEQLEEAQRERDRLKAQVEQDNCQSEKLHTQIEQLQKECNKLREANERRAPPAASSASLVKDIMNGCYQQLCDQIVDPQVLKIIAQTIKRETKAALEREGNQ